MNMVYASLGRSLVLLFTRGSYREDKVKRKGEKKGNICQHIIFKAFTSGKGKSNTRYVIQASDINTWIVKYPLSDLKSK